VERRLSVLLGFVALGVVFAAPASSGDGIKMRQVRGVCVPVCFGDRAPAWSPDGQTIAFIRRTREQARRAIFTVPALGGPGRRVTQPNRAFVPDSIAWSPESTRLAFHVLEGVNYVVPARGGEPVKAVPASTTGPFFFDHAARWSSDGSRLAIVGRALRSRRERHAPGVGRPDFVQGGTARDRIYGGPGDDRVYGGPGGDRLDAGPGFDAVYSRGGIADVVRGGSGKDTVRADSRDWIARDCELVERE